MTQVPRLAAVVALTSLLGCGGGSLDRSCPGGQINAGLGNSAWPAPRGDAGNRAFAPGPGPSAGTLRETLNLGNASGSPILGESLGRVYLAMGSAGLQAYDGQSPAWSRPGTYEVAPVVGPGVVYVVATDGTVSALSPTDGSPSWTQTVPTPVVGSPTLTPSGLVLVPSADALTAIATSGAIQWTWTATIPLSGSPVIAENNQIVIPDTAGGLTAIDDTSAYQWDLDTGSPTVGGPVVDGQCNIYLQGDDGLVRAVVDEGFIRFSSDPGGTLIATPAVLPSGGLYVAVSEAGTARLKAVTSFGNVRELTDLPSSVALAVDSNGVIFSVGNAGEVSRVVEPGTLQWTFDAGSFIGDAFALTGDGGMLVGTQDGRLLRVE